MTDSRKLAEEGWSAWWRRDLDTLMTTYADDAQLALPGMPPIAGRDAIRQVWGAFMISIPSEKALHELHVAQGDTVVTEWTGSGVNEGPTPMPNGDMLPPTGRTVTLSGATITEFRDGRVARQTFYWDNVAFMQQLGLMPG